jgi:hypothetical protein
VLKRDVGKFKRARIEPPKWDALRGMRDVTAAELIADGLRRTAERHRQLKLKLVSSTKPVEPPADKAG